jgi:tripeptidyl-peptidase-1
VHNWFAKYPPPYGADRFNNSQRTRGHPDISVSLPIPSPPEPLHPNPFQANGANYVIAIDGNFSLVYGTSASSPTTGSILTLINQARYDAGKSSIGFINPVLYAHPGILNDITEGGNQGCGTPGFSSAPGWDPVTGLGTPNYPKMLKLWLGLP